MSQVNWVLTFSEKVKGWVSFKSFTEMQLGVSMANDYYTFREGDTYKHYSEDQNRNTFYNQFSNSSIDVMLNDKPGLVKVFNTLNYEGSQSKVDRFLNEIDGTLDLPFQPQTTYGDQDYYNLITKKGWSVESIVTDQEEGNVKEFLGREGKWFNNVNRVIDIDLDIADSSDFTFQGIGEVTSATINGNTIITGCIDPTALNYDATANFDDGSCKYEPASINGCMDPLATNYNPNATSSDGSCYYPYPDDPVGLVRPVDEVIDISEKEDTKIQLTEVIPSSPLRKY